LSSVIFASALPPPLPLLLQPVPSAAIATAKMIAFMDEDFLTCLTSRHHARPRAHHVEVLAGAAAVHL
jgi:hypothetical protein